MDGWMGGWMDGGHVLTASRGSALAGWGTGIMKWGGSYKAECKDVLPRLWGGWGG